MSAEHARFHETLLNYKNVQIIVFITTLKFFLHNYAHVLTGILVYHNLNEEVYIYIEICIFIHTRVLLYFVIIIPHGPIDLD